MLKLGQRHGLWVTHTIISMANASSVNSPRHREKGKNNCNILDFGGIVAMVHADQHCVTGVENICKVLQEGCRLVFLEVT